MNAQETTENKDLSLSERLEKRFLATPNKKTQPVIFKIIQVRKVVAQQRLQGRSWADLADFLSHEHVHISDGTLRNYMGMIGTAVDELSATCGGEVSDEQIHKHVSAQMTQAARTRAAKKRAASKPRMPARPIPGGQSAILPPPDRKS